MKTRVSALAVAISTLSLLTACGGSGGPSSFSADEPTVAVSTPTVTVSAPATATVGTAFTVSWTSTDATSCAADFDSADTGPTGTFSITETTAGTKTYTVTCTGEGGTATDSKTVVIVATTVDGIWQGTAGSSRTLSGVITREGAYWLTIMNGSDIVGFYAGSGTPTVTSSTEGTYSSGNLREITFDAGGTGTTKAGTMPSASYVAKTSLSGTLAVVPTTTTADLSVVGEVTGISSSIGTGSATFDSLGTTLTLDYTVTSTVLGANVMTMEYTDTLTGTLASGVFTATAGSSTVNSCTSVSGVDYCSFSPVGPVTPSSGSFTVGGSVTIADGGTGALTLSYTTAGGPDTINYSVSNIAVASSLPSIDPDTFSFTYDVTYEETPTLTVLVDNYTGSAGVGATLDTTAASTLDVASDGTFSGAEPATGCSYSGAADVHASGGNVYDVTVTVTGCAAAGDYSGVATYDAVADKLTVTTLNAARDGGFMFVGVGATH